MRALARLTDAGGWMLVAAAAAALVLPTRLATFAGVPLDREIELAFLALLAPLFVSSPLRRELASSLGAVGRGVAMGALLAVVLAKVLLLAAAPNSDFESCYSSPLAEPLQGDCETSFADPFRLSGGTRLDRKLNFGPRLENPAAAGLNSRVLLRDGALTTSNWNLAWVNSMRFGFPAQPGKPDRNQLPLRLRTRGEVQLGRETSARVLYVGEGSLTIGDRSLRLPPSYGRIGTVRLEVPAGRVHLKLDFVFRRVPRVGPTPTVRPYALLRVEAGRKALQGADPPPGWAALRFAVDAAMVAFGALLALFMAFALRTYLPLALGLVALGLLARSVDAPHELLGMGPFFPGAAYLVPLVALLGALATRPGPRPLLAAWAGIAFLAALRTYEDFPYADSVLYPNGGDDPLTYESFASSILADGSLQGGEDVFFFQPGFRYVLFAGRLLTGAASLPLSLLGLAGLSMAVFFLVARLGVLGEGGGPPARRLAAAAICALMLALVNLDPQVGVLRVMNSEWVTWILFPVAAGLLLGSDSPRSWALGGALLGLEGFVRLNQWPLVVLVLAAFLLTLPASRRRAAVPCIGVVLAFGLLPLAHNLAYGGELEPSATGAGQSQGVMVGDLPKVASDDEVRRKVADQLRRAFYLSPQIESNERPDYRTDDMKPFALLIELAWLAAVGFAVVRRRELTGAALLLLVAPLAALGVFAVFEVVIYYPRHVVIGLLAMGVATLYVASPRSRAAP